MSAFLAYGGAYEFAGREYRWRCYATARVYEIRKREHSPNPQAPNGRQWITAHNDRRELDVLWLMDEGIEDFSQMLVQVEPEAPMRRFPMNALPAH